VEESAFGSGAWFQAVLKPTPPWASQALPYKDVSSERKRWSQCGPVNTEALSPGNIYAGRYSDLLLTFSN
jgi:hypothetical protein